MIRQPAGMIAALAFVASVLGGPVGGTDTEIVQNNCVPGILDPLSKMNFNDWPTRLDRCDRLMSILQGENKVQVSLMRVRLNYLLRNYEAAAAATRETRALLEEGAKGDTDLVRMELAVFDILFQIRADETEAALVAAKRLSDENPDYTIAHMVYEEIGLEADRFADVITAIKRQIRISPSKKLTDKLVFMLRKQEQFTEARDVILHAIDSQRSAYNVGGFLMDYAAVQLGAGEPEPAGQVLDALNAGRLQRAVHSWQSMVFAGYPSLVKKEIGAAVSFRDKKKLKELLAAYYFAVGRPDDAVLAMEGETLNCKSLDCMTLNVKLAEARGDTAEAALLKVKISRTSFSIKRLGARKWDRNLVVNFPFMPVENLGPIAHVSPEVDTRLYSGGFGRVTVKTSEAFDSTSLFQLAVSEAQKFAAEKGASGFAILDRQHRYSYRDSQIEGLEYNVFTSQEMTFQIYLTGLESTPSTAGLVPWRHVSAQ